MAQIINTNVMSLNAQRNLDKSQGSLSTALQRLSTGLRINSAKDDAAGLAISEGMTSQIRGMNQAARNTNDGISMVQTAEGALNEVTNMLQRMRELAVQSANAINSDADRTALNSEVSALNAEIDRIAKNTNFNGSNLLDGSFSGKNIQVGADAGDTIGITVGNTQSASIGSYQFRADGNMTTAVASTANTVSAAETMTIGGYINTGATINPAGGAEANTIVASINAQNTGVTASATTKADLVATATGAVTMSINGVSVSGNVFATDNLAQLSTNINNVSSQTGVIATETGGTITLIAADGRDIEVQNTSTAAAFTLQGYQGDTTTVSGGADVLSAAGTTGDSSTVGGQIVFNSIKAFTVLSSATAVGLQNGAATSDVGDLTSNTSAVSNIDISTVAGSTKALDILDGAISLINSIRSDMGALQSRFESTIVNLQTNSENLSAARSRIRDADFAAETAELTRTQILQQAGTAMLAQANAIPQNVLSLLG